MTTALIAPKASATRIRCLSAADWKRGVDREPPALRAWAEAQRFEAREGQLLRLPDAKGKPGTLLAGLGSAPDLWSFAAIAAALPTGDYSLAGDIDAEAASLGWLLAGYRFERYRKPGKAAAGETRLCWPEGADKGRVTALHEAITLARDLINTPAGDLGPADLARAAQSVAKRFKAQFKVIVGDALLKAGYPMVHAVGRAAAQAPRLIDITWGPAKAPKVTLVGKGVCFDSGGLDIKPPSGMALMKKDMAGGAIMLALAQAVMARRMNVRLRLLIPAVENAISGNAFRPGDVLRSRKGLSVEIGNTDAEGRLILADALAEADREKPDLLLDAATLTGAARVAVGPDLPALFTGSEALAADLLRAGLEAGEPLWRLPLHKPYRDYLDSRIADINNAGDTPFAGSITAALFLAEFVTETKAYAHVDLYGWAAKQKAGRPMGGEATGLRAFYRYIEKRFGKA